MDSPEVLDVAFDARADAPRAMRRATVTALEDRVEARTCEDAVLLVSELVTNVLRHTDAGGHLRIEVRPRLVLVRVCDQSTTVPQPHRRWRGAASTTGRGLRMLELIAHRVGGAAHHPWQMRVVRAAHGTPRDSRVLTDARSTPKTSDQCGDSAFGPPWWLHTETTGGQRALLAMTTAFKERAR